MLGDFIAPLSNNAAVKHPWLTGWCLYSRKDKFPQSELVLTVYGYLLSDDSFLKDCFDFSTTHICHHEGDVCFHFLHVFFIYCSLHFIVYSSHFATWSNFSTHLIMNKGFFVFLSWLWLLSHLMFSEQL